MGQDVRQTPVRHREEVKMRCTKVWKIITPEAKGRERETG